MGPKRRVGSYIDREPVYHLTRQQFEVLKLMADGLNNNAIAERLVIARDTVKNHCNAIYLTLGIAKDGVHSQRILAVKEYLRVCGSEEEREAVS